ncbi:MAG: M28 family peptidase [Cyanobacteria bacterium P01_A01_bin.135]
MDHPSISARLRSHLEVVARERDAYLATGGRVLVREYLQQQLGQWGPVERHCFSAAGHSGENLILQLPGREARPGPPLLVAAHYDGVPGSPGADDNATGVAVLLELARAWAAQPPACPVQLVAFDLEEYGLLGSRAYAQSLRQRRAPLRLMLSLEMLGYCDPTPGSQRYPPGLQWLYPNQGNFIALVGNLPAWRQTRQLSHQLQHHLPCEWLVAGWRGKLVPATRRSDHAPFWDCGYRAVMVTDTSFLRNPHYHQPSDRVETLDLSFLARVYLGLEQGLRHISTL